MELPLTLYYRDFPGGPVVKTLPSNVWGVGLSSVPVRGAKIPHTLWPKHKTEAVL